MLSRNNRYYFWEMFYEFIISNLISLAFGWAEWKNMLRYILRFIRGYILFTIQTVNLYYWNIFKRN